MSRYLIYVDGDLSKISDKLGELVDSYDVGEYFTLTEDGAPVLFDKTMVGDPDFCNGLAIRCAGITEE